MCDREPGGKGGQLVVQERRIASKHGLSVPISVHFKIRRSTNNSTRCISRWFYVRTELGDLLRGEEEQFRSERNDEDISFLPC